MSPRARIFVSLVVVALGCAVWWWLGAQQQVAPPVSGGGEAAAASADTPGGEASLSKAEAGAIERAEAALPAAQAGGRSLVVQVWLGEVGVPAARAEVFVMEQTGAASLPDVEGRGARFVADAAGRAALPSVSGVVAIAARLPGVFGARSVAADESGEVALTLLPDQTVTVRVVDASDAPVAGALVALNQRVPVVVGMEWAFEELAALEREMAALTEQIRQSTAEDVRKERAPELRQMKIE